MLSREYIINAVKRGEPYKVIAADVGCSYTWVSRTARAIGYRKNATKLGPVTPILISFPITVVDELKSRGNMSIQIRQAVEEYLERHTKNGRPSNGEVQRADAQATGRTTPATAGVMGPINR